MFSAPAPPTARGNLFEDSTLPTVDPFGNEVRLDGDLERVQGMTSVPKGSGAGWRKRDPTAPVIPYDTATCKYFGNSHLKWQPGKQMTAHCGCELHGGVHNCRLRRQVYRSTASPPHKGRPRSRAGLPHCAGTCARQRRACRIAAIAAPGSWRCASARTLR